MAHRDLKPENLLLDSDMNLKICDLGLSGMTKDGYSLNTKCGSPNYAAPELIQGFGYDGREADVWSCGIILFAMLTGSLPFDTSQLTLLFKEISSASFSMPHHVSEDA